MSNISRISISSALSSPWVRGGSVVTAIALGAITYMGHYDYSRLLKALNVKQQPDSQSWPTRILNLFKRGLSVLRNQSFSPVIFKKINLTSLSATDLKGAIEVARDFTNVQVEQFWDRTDIDAETQFTFLTKKMGSSQIDLPKIQEKMKSFLQTLNLDQVKKLNSIQLDPTNFKTYIQTLIQPLQQETINEWLQKNAYACIPGLSTTQLNGLTKELKDKLSSNAELLALMDLDQVKTVLMFKNEPKYMLRVSNLLTRHQILNLISDRTQDTESPRIWAKIQEELTSLTLEEQKENWWHNIPKYLSPTQILGLDESFLFLFWPHIDSSKRDPVVADANLPNDKLTKLLPILDNAEIRTAFLKNRLTPDQLNSLTDDRIFSLFEMIFNYDDHNSEKNPAEKLFDQLNVKKQNELLLKSTAIQLVIFLKILKSPENLSRLTSYITINHPDILMTLDRKQLPENSREQEGIISGYAKLIEHVTDDQLGALLQPLSEPQVVSLFSMFFNDPYRKVCVKLLTKIQSSLHPALFKQLRPLSWWITPADALAEAMLLYCQTELNCYSTWKETTDIPIDTWKLLVMSENTAVVTKIAENLDLHLLSKIFPSLIAHSQIRSILKNVSDDRLTQLTRLLSIEQKDQLLIKLEPSRAETLRSFIQKKTRGL